MDSNTRRKIIMNHYEHPLNRGLTADNRYIKINTNNESCIDNLDLEILIENNVIKDLRFDGEACAVSTSTTSVMIGLLLNKTIHEALDIINNYEAMINECPYESQMLGEALAYDEIYKQPNRKTCALLPWGGIKKVLINYLQ